MEYEEVLPMSRGEIWEETGMKAEARFQNSGQQGWLLEQSGLKILPCL